MPKPTLLLTLIILAAITGGLILWQQPAQPAPAQASLLPLLADENTAGFARATEPNAIQFPRDFGPHPDYQTEWWYYTGILETENGRLFGYQFTIFRRALTPQSPISSPQTSNWRTNQTYLAHFAIADIANSAFYPHERFSRGAAGLAGAQAAPYRVWLQNWVIEETAPGQVRLLAQADDVGLDITLSQTLPPILHGSGGLSPKGPERGNASYYYSQVQQASQGIVRIGSQRYPVTGLSWKDHEYSTSALSANATGWDWFSLQFDNGAALMLFQIRRTDGTLEPTSSGTYIHPDGTTTPLTYTDWTLTVTDTWTSPDTGATYPAGWELTIPTLNLALTGAPLMPNQELILSTTYWEGASAFSGTFNNQPITARGYIEMTGY